MKEALSRPLCDDTLSALVTAWDECTSVSDDALVLDTVTRLFGQRAGPGSDCALSPLLLDFLLMHLVDCITDERLDVSAGLGGLLAFAEDARVAVARPGALLTPTQVAAVLARVHQQMPLLPDPAVAAHDATRVPSSVPLAAHTVPLAGCLGEAQLEAARGLCDLACRALSVVLPRSPLPGPEETHAGHSAGSHSTVGDGNGNGTCMKTAGATLLALATTALRLCLNNEATCVAALICLHEAKRVWTLDGDLECGDDPCRLDSNSEVAPVALTLAAMERHPASASVQSAGCALLAEQVQYNDNFLGDNLLDIPLLRRWSRAVGGVLAHHAHDASVVSAALYALLASGADGYNNVEVTWMPPKTRSASEPATHEESDLEPAFAFSKQGDTGSGPSELKLVIWPMSDGFGARLIVAAGSIIPLVTQALVIHRCDASVVWACLRVLSSATACDERSTTVAIPAVAAAMRAHPQLWQIVYEGAKVMVLAREDEATAEAMAAVDGESLLHNLQEAVKGSDNLLDALLKWYFTEKRSQPPAHAIAAATVGAEGQHDSHVHSN